MNTIRPSGARHVVVVMLCLAAAIVYLSRNCLGVAVADGQILKDLNLSKQDIGWVMGFGFFFFYSIFQVPSGWLGQRIGSRRILTLILLGSSILTALMGMVTALAGIMVIYLGIGMVQSGIFPCSAKTAKAWIPSTRLAFMGGALGSFMSVGGALASMLCGALLGWTTWRVVFFLFAIPGVIWAIAFFWWFRDDPADHSSVNSDELKLITGGDMKPAAKSGSIPWRAMATTPAMWWLCGQQFFRAAGYIFYSTWFPTFLKETRGVSTESAGYLSSLPMLAVVVSCVSGGVFVDYLQRKTGSRRISRQFVAIACMLGCAGFICLAYFAENTTMAVLLISAGSFCASFGGPCQYVTTIDLADKDTAVVFGVVNMAGNIGAALFPVVVPYLVTTTGSWDAVLFVFAGIYVAAAACWALLNPYATLQNPYATKQTP